MPNFNNAEFMAFLRMKLLNEVDGRKYKFSERTQITITPSIIEIFKNNEDLLLGSIWKENECTVVIRTTTHHFFDNNTRFNLVLSFDYEGLISSDEYISTYILNLINITNFELQEVVQIR